LVKGFVGPGVWDISSFVHMTPTIHTYLPGWPTTPIGTPHFICPLFHHLVTLGRGGFGGYCFYELTKGFLLLVPTYELRLLLLKGLGFKPKLRVFRFYGLIFDLFGTYLPRPRWKRGKGVRLSRKA
jgi:hypothetical protein